MKTDLNLLVKTAGVIGTIRRKSGRVLNRECVESTLGTAESKSYPPPTLPVFPFSNPDDAEKRLEFRGSE